MSPHHPFRSSAATRLAMPDGPPPTSTRNCPCSVHSQPAILLRIPRMFSPRNHICCTPHNPFDTPRRNNHKSDPSRTAASCAFRANTRPPLSDSHSRRQPYPPDPRSHYRRPTPLPPPLDRLPLQSPRPLRRLPPPRLRFRLDAPLACQ